MPEGITTHTLTLPDGSYTWGVRTVSSAGAMSQPTPGESFVVDTIAPDVPAAPTSGEPSEDSIALSWSVVPDAAYYELRYRNADGEWTSRRVTNATAAELTDLPLGNYTWQVRAVDASGNVSDWCSEQSFDIVASEVAVETLWVRGIVLDADGQVLSGYHDVAKTGTGDSQLCWAAAAGNMLAWWQGYYETADFSASGSVPPQSAQEIFSTFVSNWENVSGRVDYGCIWWLSGTADVSAYQEYYQTHYSGNTDAGGYYNTVYTPTSVAEAVTMQKLHTLTETEVASTLSGVISSGGVAALNLYGSLSSTGTLSQGHTVTLWGVTQEKESGLLVSVSITDSDDDRDGVVTLNLTYDEASGYYRVAEEPNSTPASTSSLSGYYLAGYSALRRFEGDVVPPILGEPEIVSEKISNGLSRVTLRWISNDPTALYEVRVNGVLIYAGADTSCMTELTDGEHTYTILAKDRCDNTSHMEGEFATDATAPIAAVAVRSVEELGKGRIRVTFNVACDDVDASCTLVLDGESHLLGTERSLTLEMPEGTHAYTLAVKDAYGNESCIEDTFVYDTTAPSAIEGLTADYQELNKVLVLTWQASTDASAVRYGVEYSTKADFSDATSLELTIDTTCIIPTDATGESIHYRVRAIDALGNVTPWAVGSSQTPDKIAPSAVNHLSGTVEGNTLTLSWSHVSDPSGVSYIVEYADNASWEDVQTCTTLNNYLTLNGLTDGMWYWRVRAADGAGNASVFAEGTPVFVDVTAPTMSADSMKVEVSETAAKLSWAELEDISGIAGYRVEYGTSATFAAASTSKMQVAGIDLTLFDLSTNAMYYWRVAAVDKLGNVAAWTQGENFFTKVRVEDNTPQTASELDFSDVTGVASATEWVGFGDRYDYYKVSSAVGGVYDIVLAKHSEQTAPVYLSIGTLDAKGEYVAQRVIAVGAGAAITGLDGVAMEGGKDYYIRVASYDDGAGSCNTNYTLEVQNKLRDEPELPGGRVTADNDYASARALTWLAEDTEGVRGWVGYGDAADTYAFSLDTATQTHLKLSVDDQPVRVKLYKANAQGGITQVAVASAGQGGLDKELSLSAGSYYVQVTAYDNGAGRYNTAYTLDMETEQVATRRQAMLASV